jgi:hypothetical protein
MTNPDYVNLQLPADTVSVTADTATIILTASGDGRLVPQLALNTREMGWYRIYMNRAVFVSMLGQLDYLKGLTPDQLGDITTRLHNGGNAS